MSRLLVVGTIFMDCKAYAGQGYNPQGRNLGTIEFVDGGVGRNVAENVASLGNDVFFVATVDSSAVGKGILSRLKDRKVDTRFVKEVPSNGMGIWSVIMDKNGAQLGAVSQMPDIALLEAHVEANYKEMVASSEVILLEIDLSEKISNIIITEAKANNKPVYILPGNMDVVMKHPKLVSQCDCFICNDIEAGKLFETSFKLMPPEVILKHSKEAAARKGINSMVITLGDKGSIYFDLNKGQEGCQGIIDTSVIDTCGAGDAFFSGFTSSLARGLSMKDSAQFGAKTAGAVIGVKENTIWGLDII